MDGNVHVDGKGLKLVSDAYLTANRTRCMWSSTQETTPLDYASPTTTPSQAAGNDSRLCCARNTQNSLCGKTKAACQHLGV